MTSLLIKNVRPWGADPVDLHVVDGVITAAAAELPPDLTIDGEGRIALPALVDAHAHLDKTLWGQPYRPHTAGPGLAALIENERAARAGLAPVAQRAGALLDQQIKLGVLHLRSHVDVDPEIGLDSVLGVLAAARERADRVSVEVVLYPQNGLLTRPGTAGLVADALDAGAHLIGGVDPAEVDGDPIRFLDTAFGMAAEKGVGLDIHLHDPGTLGAWQVHRIVERAHDFAMRGRVTISHCFCLSTLDGRQRAMVIDALAGADVALTTVAAGHTPPLPLAELRAAAVRVGLGNDSVRGLWNPYGTGDLLEKAHTLVMMLGLRRDTDIESVMRLATEGSAAVLGLPAYGLGPACAANLVLLPGSSPVEVLMNRPTDRVVIAQGRKLN